MTEPRRTWYHTIDLPDGTCTPGWFDTRRAPAHVPWPAVAGARCLDVGTFDGFWAFEMERRGAAEVVAMDLDDPRRLDWPYDERQSGPAGIAEWGSGRGPGFAEAAAALGSSVRWQVGSVYDLDPEADGTFDVVLCGSLLLHLRDPVLALEHMRGVCGQWLVLVEAVDPVLDVLVRPVPAAQFHPERDEWWRMNAAGLRRLVETAGFAIVQEGPRFLIPLGPGAPSNLRLSGWAGVAVRRPGQRGLLVRGLLATPRAPTGGAS